MVSLVSNSHPQRKSIALAGDARVYRTFEDWQAEQQLDQRTPAQRGISVGSSVMWRHRDRHVIVTDHATVTAISHDTLTLLVKDVQSRTCEVDIREIVNHALGHLSAAEARWRVIFARQSEGVQAAEQTTAMSSAQVSLADIMDAASGGPRSGSATTRRESL